MRFQGPSQSIDSNTSTDGSGTITTGGVSQVLFSTTAIGYSIHNLDLYNELWVSESGTATPLLSGSFKIDPGGFYETHPNRAPVGVVAIIGFVAGQKFTARKW